MRNRLLRRIRIATAAKVGYAFKFDKISRPSGKANKEKRLSPKNRNEVSNLHSELLKPHFLSTLDANRAYTFCPHSILLSNFRCTLTSKL